MAAVGPELKLCWLSRSGSAWESVVGRGRRGEMKGQQGSGFTGWGCSAAPEEGLGVDLVEAKGHSMATEHGWSLVV